MLTNPTPWPGLQAAAANPSISTFRAPLYNNGRGDIGSRGMAAVRLSSLRVLDGCNSPYPSGHNDFSCRKGRMLPALSRASVRAAFPRFSVPCKTVITLDCFGRPASP
ncbi:hypothetical protein ED328_07595 [Muribaculaceae bacterium Isolate-001 (NCI)]|nr:hypothetical protein ED328_07595 [Muribaculaceae bacterium Isolate-001 (NCI)]